MQGSQLLPEYALLEFIALFFQLKRAYKRLSILG